MSNIQEKINDYGPTDRKKGLFRTIDPNQEYDRDIFSSHMYTYHNDLNKAYERFKKDPNDEYNLGKLGKYLHQDRGYFFSQKNPALTARSEAYQATDSAQTAMGHYVRNNLEVFLEKNDDQSLANILFSTDLIMDGDEDYNKVVNALNDLHAVQAASQDAGKANEFIKDRMDEMPEWLRKAYGLYSSNPEYIQSTMQTYSGLYQQKVMKEIANSSGKLDKGKIEQILKHHLDLGWRAYRKEEREAGDDGDQSDIFDENLRGVYSQLAMGIFQSENREYEKRTNFAKVQREEERERQHVKD